METTFTGGPNIWQRLAQAVRDISIDTAYLAPVAAFLFISSTPAQSLAFAEYVHLSHQPLKFVRDGALADSAIMGLDAWPRYRTAGRALKAASARIPDAAPNLTAGSAVRVLAMAYSSSVNQTDANPWSTASGTTVKPGTIAANFLPFGSRVRVGGTIYTVEDRMNPRYNGKYIIDIWQPTREDALVFGVRVVEMEVVHLP